MRRALLAATAATFLLTGTVMADTFTYSHSANAGGEFVYIFTAPNDGDVTARIVWKPKRNGGYTMNLVRLSDCADYSTKTAVYVRQTTQQANGDWTLTAPNATATSGTECWRVDFWAYSGGKVNATLTVTVP